MEAEEATDLCWEGFMKSLSHHQSHVILLHHLFPCSLPTWLSYPSESDPVMVHYVCNRSMPGEQDRPLNRPQCWTWDLSSQEWPSRCLACLLFNLSFTMLFMSRRHFIRTHSCEQPVSFRWSKMDIDWTYAVSVDLYINTKCLWKFVLKRIFLKRSRSDLWYLIVW